MAKHPPHGEAATINRSLTLWHQWHEFSEVKGNVSELYSFDMWTKRSKWKSRVVHQTVLQKLNNEVKMPLRLNVYGSSHSKSYIQTFCFSAVNPFEKEKRNSSSLFFLISDGDCVFVSNVVWKGERHEYLPHFPPMLAHSVLLCESLSGLVWWCGHGLDVQASDICHNSTQEHLDSDLWSWHHGSSESKQGNEANLSKVRNHCLWN